MASIKPVTFPLAKESSNSDPKKNSLLLSISLGSQRPTVSMTHDGYRSSEATLWDGFRSTEG